MKDAILAVVSSREKLKLRKDSVDRSRTAIAPQSKLRPPPKGNFQHAGLNPKPCRVKA